MASLTNSTFQTAITNWFGTLAQHNNVVANYGQMSNWNTSSVTNMDYAFQNRINSGTGSGFFTGKVLNESVSNWNTANVTTMEGMFEGATFFNSNIKKSVNKWNTTKVTNMGNMFSGAASFEGAGVGTWETDKVTNMQQMFFNASAFNADLTYSGTGNIWNTGLVTNMSSMFQGATIFEGMGVSTWTVSNLTNIVDMFTSAGLVTVNNHEIWNMWSTAPISFTNTQLNNAGLLIDYLEDATFQTSINKWFSTTGTNHIDVVARYGQMTIWDTSLVTNMDYAFQNKINSGTGSGFFTGLQVNESVSNWNTANVTTMYAMFSEAIHFNGTLTYTGGNIWNTSIVINMGAMFNSATDFQGNGVGTWDTHSVTNMNAMFNDSSLNATLTYNGIDNIWNTGIVEDMSSMFSFCTNIISNGINTWDTHSVTYMQQMFSNASQFNADLTYAGSGNIWNTGAVTNMSSMFNNATVFEGTGVSTWDTHSVTTMTLMFSNAYAFNADLSLWSVSNVLYMINMFTNASSFLGEGVSEWIISGLTFSEPPAASPIYRMFFGSEITSQSNNAIWDAWLDYTNAYRLLEAGLISPYTPPTPTPTPTPTHTPTPTPTPTPSPTPKPVPFKDLCCPPPIFSKPNSHFGGNVNLTTVSNTNAFRYAALVQQRKGKTVIVAQAPMAISPPRNRF